jgi:beta-phosphoglucomutase-like phosphatase (HAD superfamily)
MRTLNTLGVESLIDLVVCGDDRHSKPKPDPGNALFICHQLGVPPADAMVSKD